MDRDKAFELKLQLTMQDLKSLDSLLILGFGALGFGGLNHPDMLDGSDLNMNLAMLIVIVLIGWLMVLRHNLKKVILRKVDLVTRKF